MTQCKCVPRNHAKHVCLQASIRQSKCSYQVMPYSVLPVDLTCLNLCLGSKQSFHHNGSQSSTRDVSLSPDKDQQHTSCHCTFSVSACNLCRYPCQEHQCDMSNCRLSDCSLFGGAGQAQQRTRRSTFLANLQDSPSLGLCRGL